MKDCERIIIVFYVDVTVVHKIDEVEYLTDFANNLGFDETVIPLVIPSRNGEETHVEVLNPRYISKKEYKELVEKANKYLDKFNNKTEK